MGSDFTVKNGDVTWENGGFTMNIVIYPWKDGDSRRMKILPSNIGWNLLKIWRIHHEKSAIPDTWRAEDTWYIPTIYSVLNTGEHVA